MLRSDRPGIFISQYQSEGERLKRLFKAIALVFLLIFPITALAQDDYFPPPGIYIPCCSSGGTGGHTGAVYGKNGQSAWRQVWGATPGDVVTFRFVLRARSAGSLHAFPRTTGGSDPQYLGDPNNPLEKWYWNTWQRSSGGTFCIDCPWQFTANDYNPWIYVEYWDSGDGWDVDLNVVNISKPSFKVLPDHTKEAYHRGGNVLITLGSTAQLIALFPCQFADGISCAILTSTGIIAQFVGGMLLQVDPWDDWYAYPYDPVFPSAEQLGMAWTPTGYGVPFWDTILNDNNIIVWSATAMHGYLTAANISINRAMSCAQISAGCEEWQAERARQFFEAANYHAYWAAAAMWELANQYQQQGFGDEYINVWNSTAWEFWQIYNNSVR